MAKTNNQDGTLYHFGAVRMRVLGSGSLRMRLLSLSESRTTTLVPFIMDAATAIEPTRISNFTQQRAQLEIKTTSIDERFVISKIVIFTKPVATSVPGG